MTKKTQLSIEFSVPQGTGKVKATISPDGSITFLDETGESVAPDYMSRTVSYPRSKGPKIQLQGRTDRGGVTIGGVSELSLFDSVFVIDTNSRKIGHSRVSVACFVCLRFTSAESSTTVNAEEKINIYEFHDVPGNPEMLAILKVANDVARSSLSNERPKIRFVTDSELGAIESISSRRSPIYAAHLLPENMSLEYASSDTGQEALNRFIRFCDKQSSRYLDLLESGELEAAKLQSLDEDPTVKYRYMSQVGLEVLNPEIRGPSIGPNTTYTLYGIK